MTPCADGSGHLRLRLHLQQGLALWKAKPPEPPVCIVDNQPVASGLDGDEKIFSLGRAIIEVSTKQCMIQQLHLSAALVVIERCCR